MGIIKDIYSKITGTKQILSPRRPFFSRSGTVVNEDSSMQVAAFYRGLMYISTQIAKLPWDVKDGDHKIIKGSIYDLLNICPNPEMTAFRWKIMMIQQSIILGNAYSEIERDGAGRPIGLWPLDARAMDIIRDDQGKLKYRYANPNGTVSLLNPKDVFHVPNFHTKDGIIGQGVVAYGRDVLGIQVAADEMAAGMFHNSGIPSGVLKHKGKLSDEAYKRLKDTWKQEQGGRNTGATSILEEDMTYEPVKVDPEMLQFLQSRQFGVLEIARFLGVPPTKLFDVTASTYSNVEQSNLEVATDTLDAWCTNLEQEADVKLLNNRFGGRYTDLDLYSIFRGDMGTRSKYFKDMMSAGAMTPNQIRAREGLPAYKEGDNYYIATNNFTPVNRMNEIIDADIKQKEKSSQPTPAKEPTKQEQALEAAALDFLKGKRD